MKLTAQEEIGVRLMMALAEAFEKGKGEVRISYLASKEKIGPANAAKVLNQLSKSGLVKGVRGVKGGYILARKPEEITLFEIMSALSDPSDKDLKVPISQTGRLIDCPRFPGCNLNVVWRALEKAMEEILSQVTLEDLVKASKAELEERLGLGEGEASGASVLVATLRQSQLKRQL